MIMNVQASADVLDSEMCDTNGEMARPAKPVQQAGFMLGALQICIIDI